MSQFGPEIDALFANATEDVPFRKILEAYRPTKVIKDGVEMAQSISLSNQSVHQKLESALETANQRKVVTDARARVRKAIETINRNLGKLSCDVGGKEIRGENFKQVVPEVFKSHDMKTHTATANVGSKAVKLEIEWKQ
jgi:hypothetical protein